MSVYPWQLAAWQRLQSAKENNHLHHALLFCGEAGCGNETFLEKFAHSLLCLNPTHDGSACKQCRSCQVLLAQAHPDFMTVKMLEDKQSILIDQIRELNYFLGLSRSYSLRRVVIVYSAERMNTHAANGLLKSLEEPSADTHILLLTEHPALLLPTIRSRCQMVRLPFPTHQQALEWLQQQHTLQHPPESLLEAALGRPLLAFALDSTDDTLHHHDQWLAHLTQCLQGQGNITEISAHWEKFDKVKLLNWQFAWLQRLIKQQAVSKHPSPSALHHLLDLYDNLLELKKLSTHPLNPRLFVESMLALRQQSF